MRSFPTLRDAEIAYSQLEDRLGKLEKKITLLPSQATMTSELSNKFGDSRPGTPPSVTNITNVVQESIDSVLSADGTTVTHNLWHIFRSHIRGMGMFELGGNGFPTWRWVTNNSTANMQLNYVDPTVAKNFAMWFTAGPTLAQSELLFEGIFGQVSVRLAKLYTKSLSVLPGANPTAGMVLTALDATGECYWAAPSAGGSAFSQQKMIPTDTGLISGAWVTLNMDVALPSTGYYLIHLNASFTVGQNDYQIQARCSSNQSGSFITLNGQMNLTKDPALPGNVTSTSFAWTTFVGSMPCTVRIEGTKQGTGSSNYNVNTSVIVTKVG